MRLRRLESTSLSEAQEKVLEEYPDLTIVGSSTIEPGYYEIILDS